MTTRRKTVAPPAISVVGIGGGGCKIVDAMTRQRDDMVATAALNTDVAELAASTATTKLQIGSALTDGHGTGGDARLGARVATDDLHIIQNLFTDTGLALVVVGLGGGLGTGAAPVVLKAARDADAATICLATIPFSFEGEQRRYRAEGAIVDLLGACDALIVVQNDRLLESVGKTAMADALAEGDRVLGSGLACIWKLVARPGYINLDFADLRRVVRSSGGMCTLGFGYGKGRTKASRVTSALLNGPMLDRGRVIADARSLLVSIVGGTDLTVKEIGDIMAAIKAKAGDETEIELGTSIDAAENGSLSVAVIASELWSSPEGERGPVAETPAAEPAEQPRKTKGKGKGKKKARRSARTTQTQLQLETEGRGRFRDVEPTVLYGEDVDVPTFVRRNIRVER